MLIIPPRNRHIFNQMNLQFIRPLLSDAHLLNPRQALFYLRLDDVDILGHKGTWLTQCQDRLPDIVITRVMAFTGQHQL